MKKMWLVVLGVWFTAACAGNPFPLRPYQPAAHGTAVEEWPPHDHVGEWWYVTGVLADQEERQYFYQFTVFHGYRLNMFEGYILHLAVTDVSGGRHWFFEDFSPPHDRVFGNQKEIVFKDSRIVMASSSGLVTAMEVRGEAGDFSFAFHLRPRKGAVWHGRNGIVTMGHEDQAAQRSFYYSYTDLETEGGLVINGASLPVKGGSWFDRQWGVFTETGWDWFSLRLADGRDIMLFSFPASGYGAGTIVAPDGRAVSVPSFRLQRLKSVEYSAPDAVFSLGWRVVLDTGEEFRILPLMADQYNPAENTPPYWEGVCSVLSMKGEVLGYCVTETTIDAREGRY